MPVVEFLHTSAYGTYWIECDVVSKVDDDHYTIAYIDPVIEERLIQTVSDDRLKFPLFVDLVM